MASNNSGCGIVKTVIVEIRARALLSSYSISDNESECVSLLVVAVDLEKHYLRPFARKEAKNIANYTASDVIIHLVIYSIL